jgi:hypothetical protein
MLKATLKVRPWGFQLALMSLETYWARQLAHKTLEVRLGMQWGLNQWAEWRVHQMGLQWQEMWWGLM